MGWSKNDSTLSKSREGELKNIVHTQEKEIRACAVSATPALAWRILQCNSAKYREI